MRYRTLMTFLASVITGVGAAIITTPPPAEAREEGWACGEGELCEEEEDKTCNYGQEDEHGNCDISWPPPCPTCADDCCVTSSNQNK